MKDVEIVVFNDKSWVRLTEYQKLDEEIKQLKSELESYQILAFKRGEAYLASLKDEQNLKKENEKLKEQFETDLEYAKAIIKDLLNNSHEYSRQNAEDFIKGEKK